MLNQEQQAKYGELLGEIIGKGLVIAFGMYVAYVAYHIIKVAA